MTPIDDPAAPWGDPEDWDEIPETFLDQLVAAIGAYGWTVGDAHESGVQVDVPGLGEDAEWWCGHTSHAGWTYGVTDERGVTRNPVELLAGRDDPQEVAGRINEVLTAAYGPAQPRLL